MLLITRAEAMVTTTNLLTFSLIPKIFMFFTLYKTLTTACGMQFIHSFT